MKEFKSKLTYLITTYENNNIKYSNMGILEKTRETKMIMKDIRKVKDQYEKLYKIANTEKAFKITKRSRQLVKIFKKALYHRINTTNHFIEALENNGGKLNYKYLLNENNMAIEYDKKIKKLLEGGLL